MDITKLKNNKYIAGDFRQGNEAHRGWFVGDFFEQGHPAKTEKIEMMYTEHEPGHKCKPHYHQHKVELIIMLEGKARYNINGSEVMLESGHYLFVDANNIVEAEFLEPSKILAAHAPSLPSDKVVM
jgi:quercetin dioxygenase-like cupin family protein